MTFRESVKQKLIVAANEYNKLVGVDFLAKSKEFKNNSNYLLRFHKDNFLHLTGVSTTLSANDFFEKCLIGDISFEDFDCDSSEEIKGKAREKLRHLQSIGSFFDRELIFQEDYQKNTVKCKIASSDGNFTLGFKSLKNSINIPLTLLNRNQIKEELAIKNVKIEKIIRNSLK